MLGHHFLVMEEGSEVAKMGFPKSPSSYFFTRKYRGIHVQLKGEKSKSQFCYTVEILPLEGVLK